MSDLHLLPYLRRGLVRHVATADAAGGGLPPGQVTVGLEVAGSAVNHSVSLLGPHHVTSIAAGEILRRWPAPGADDVETNYFPLVEFHAPDLPWRYTPARPRAGGKLRPWIALVVVEEEAPGIEFVATGASAGRLIVDPDQISQLPPHEDLWGWAHVQSSVPVDDVAAAALECPESLLARILCPRRLEPGHRYRAALVNAFRAGADERSEPAWPAAANGKTELVVYDTWTFATAAEGGDFESLCERLEPASEVGELGIRTIDVTDPGTTVSWPRSPMTNDFIGALADPDVISDRPPAGSSAFAAAVEPILEEVLSRAADGRGGDPGYDALRDDPVVGLPFYASWPAAATSVPAGGWARACNLRTDRRIAAGLGARTVRKNQEALMAAAWDQLGSIREAADELNRGRLGAEVARSWQSRVQSIEDGDRLGLTAPLLSFVRVGTEPARKVIADGPAPMAMVDRAWMRRTPRGRGASAATAWLRASSPDAGASDLGAFDYQTVMQPDGVHAIDEQLTQQDGGDGLFSIDAVQHIDQAGLTTVVGTSRLARYLGGEFKPYVPRVRTPAAAPAPSPRGSSSVTVSTAAAAARARAVATGSAAEIANAVAGLDQLAAVRASLVSRIPALDRLLPSGELPAEFQLAPEFTDALFWDLVRLDSDVIVPGLGEFPNNRVRLLGVNAGFVGAYLIGANHEMAREFLWREYPADLTATFFQRFFDYTDETTVDIEPMDDWDPHSSISDNLPRAASSTVLLIRGDLVRRYPEVSVFLTPQSSDGQPDHGAAVQPSFTGKLAADVLVVGFPVDPDTVLGRTGRPEHFVALEERVVAPRYGLDVERSGRLTSWDELAWTDFDDAIEHVGASEIPGLGAHEIDGIQWGRNSAHLAAAVHQRPYRRLYPATRLIGA